MFLAWLPATLPITLTSLSSMALGLVPGAFQFLSPEENQNDPLTATPPTILASIPDGAWVKVGRWTTADGLYPYDRLVALKLARPLPRTSIWEFPVVNDYDGKQVFTYARIDCKRSLVSNYFSGTKGIPSQLVELGGWKLNRWTKPTTIRPTDLAAQLKQWKCPKN
ncbi:MAG: hypothetical protein ACKOCM_10620 [Cyanobacteriota bacterium]